MTSTSSLSEGASTSGLSGDIPVSSSLVGSGCSSAETPASEEAVDNAAIGLMLDTVEQFGGQYMALVFEEKAPTKGNTYYIIQKYVVPPGKHTGYVSRCSLRWESVLSKLE